LDFVEPYLPGGTINKKFPVANVHSMLTLGYI